MLTGHTGWHTACCWKNFSPSKQQKPAKSTYRKGRSASLSFTKDKTIPVLRSGQQRNGPSTHKTKNSMTQAYIKAHLDGERTETKEPRANPPTTSKMWMECRQLKDRPMPSPITRAQFGSHSPNRRWPQ